MNIKIQEILRLKNGSIMIQLETKEATDWLRSPANEASFTKSYNPETCIWEHVHLQSGQCCSPQRDREDQRYPQKQH